MERQKTLSSQTSNSTNSISTPENLSADRSNKLSLVDSCVQVSYDWNSRSTNTSFEITGSNNFESSNEANAQLSAALHSGQTNVQVYCDRVWYSNKVSVSILL